MNLSNAGLQIEMQRVLLANQKKYIELARLYGNKYTGLRNPNTKKFWNSSHKGLKKQGLLEKDKLLLILDWLHNKGGNILDIGFGRGELLQAALKTRRFRLYGIDISEVAVNETGRKLKGEFKIGRANKLLYGANKFDIIVALELLEHVSPDHTFLVLKEIKRVLKKSGSLIISVPLNEDLKNSYILSGHVRSYTSELIRAEMNIAGFKVLKEKHFYAFKKWYGLKKILRRLILKTRWKPNNILLLLQKK